MVMASLTFSLELVRQDQVAGPMWSTVWLAPIGLPSTFPQLLPLTKALLSTGPIMIDLALV